MLSDGCFAQYQGMVIIVTYVPNFNVTQIKVNSDHFAQRHQKKDVQKLLEEIQDLSRSDMSWIMAIKRLC